MLLYLLVWYSTILISFIWYLSCCFPLQHLRACDRLYCDLVGRGRFSIYANPRSPAARHANLLVYLASPPIASILDGLHKDAVALCHHPGRLAAPFESQPASSASSPPACEEKSGCSPPVLNLVQDRSCHQESRAARIYLIVRDGSLNSYGPANYFAYRGAFRHHSNGASP